MAWLLKIFKSFFFSLDNTLFNFIGTLYDLLMAISRTTILTQGDIAELVGRVQLLLGIFMLFKLSFSFITYIINPDDFSDKSKGFGKLMQNAVISLLMLVLVPYVFQMAYNLQTKILEENVLARLILGTENENEKEKEKESYLASAGQEMAFYTMLPFFKPNYSIDGLEECLYMYDENHKFSTECEEALKSIANAKDDKDNDKSSDFEETDVYNYKYGVENKSLGLTFRMSPAIAIYNNAGNEQFIFNYQWPISTVVAVVVCLILVTFCIDVGVRSVKLAFLQLIYPIPVISFMDPKSGKDGMFKKWYQMCISTFLSLFIRLLALYFGIYIISKVGDMGLYDVITGSQITNGWVFIFILIGVLMFVKQLPKILENLGIKLDGDGKFSLNPLKKIEDGMFGGKMVSKVAKGAAIGASGAALVGGASLLTGKGVRGTGAAVKNALTGGFKGNKFGKNFTTSYGVGAARKNKLNEMDADGVKPWDVTKANMAKKFGLETKGEKASQVESKAKALQSAYDAIKNQAIACDDEAKNISKTLDEMKKTQLNPDDYKKLKRNEKGHIMMDPITGKAQMIQDVDAYQAALEAQRDRIKEQESKLETRITQLANGVKTNSESANRVIAQAVESINSLKKDINDIGASVDKDFVKITADDGDVVGIFKQSKGASAQASSGKFAEVKDIDKYANKSKK